MKVLARLALLVALLAPSGRTAGIALRGPQEARDGSPYPTPSPEADRGAALDLRERRP